MGRRPLYDAWLDREWLGKQWPSVQARGVPFWSTRCFHSPPLTLELPDGEKGERWWEEHGRNEVEKGKPFLKFWSHWDTDWPPPFLRLISHVFSFRDGGVRAKSAWESSQLIFYKHMLSALIRSRDNTLRREQHFRQKTKPETFFLFFFHSLFLPENRTWCEKNGVLWMGTERNVSGPLVDNERVK